MTALAERPEERQRPPFLLRSSMNGIGDAPGKVWFFELAAAVIDADRCVRCGACVAACPTDSLGVNADDLPYLVKMCTGCSLCWDFCPRGGLRYEATWPDELPAETSPGGVLTGEPGRGLGVVVDSFAARVRPDSSYAAATAQDGGFVSAVLAAALDAGAIDGALVAQEDPDTPWRAVPHVATSRDEIIAASGSFYNQTMGLAALDFGRFGLDASARIAVVGTPCEIQGIRALQASSWRKGASCVDAITLSIALMCTKSFDYQKLMLRELRDQRGVRLEDVTKVDVVHGRFLVFGESGAALIDEPVRNFHGAALKGCDECADFLGRGADLSVGSVGSEDGFSSVLVRSREGVDAVGRVLDDVELAPISRPEAISKLDQLDKRIALANLRRTFDPNGPLFIEFSEHASCYQETDSVTVGRPNNAPPH